MARRNDLENLNRSFIEDNLENSKNVIHISENKESLGFILFAIYSLLSGVISFHNKFLINEYKFEYNVFLFTFWRNLPIIIISYYTICYKKIEIIKVQNVVSKFWFVVRMVGQFLASTSFLYSLHYLRAATAMTISSLSPIIVIFFGTIILKEKFHSRYILGFFLCFFAAVLIISSERKVKVNINEPNVSDDIIVENPLRILKNQLHSSEHNIITGLIWSFINLIFFSLSPVSSKILTKENLGPELQNFYMSITSLALSYILFLFEVEGSFFSFKLYLILHSCFNGIFFYISMIFLILSFKYVDLNKTTSLSFLPTLTTFFLGVLILGDNIFLTDIIGASIIVVYNILNSMYPVN